MMITIFDYKCQKYNFHNLIKFRVSLKGWVIFRKLVLNSKQQYISTSFKKAISILSHIAKKLQIILYLILGEKNDCFGNYDQSFF